MLKKTPNIIHLKSELREALFDTHANINDKWVPARPLGFSSWKYRLKATWLVFTGQADALIWPEGQ